MKTVEVTKKITRLYQDCGYKGKSEHKCNICDYRINKFLYSDDILGYKTTLQPIKEHIITSHPEFCYICTKKRNKCDNLFTSIADSKNHKHDKV